MTSTLFLCGDVMTGRGIDQILKRSVDPRLYEPWVRDAREYVRLAEEHNGVIDQPVDDAYIWGDALTELEVVQPDLRLINLETSITTCDSPWIGKGIHYRMHPDNIGCLTAAGIDGCSLANNHVLDWSYEGLVETLSVLAQAGIGTAGAGLNRQQAERPAVFQLPQGGRVILVACGVDSSGVSEAWEATAEQPGVFHLPDLSARSVEMIAGIVKQVKREGDIAVLSIHWGSNWGYQVEAEQQKFAYAAIEQAGGRYHPWAFFSSPAGLRGASRQAHPVRLRRLHQRLRGHQWL